VKAMRLSGDRELSDDRILGSGEFVELIIKEAEAKIKYQLPMKEQDQKIDEFISKLCKSAKVSIKELRSGNRRKEVSGVRFLIAVGLVRNHGVSFAEVARRVGVSTTAVSKILKRAGQQV
jgi:DNA-directed RNA polymerase specialized sigma subunit